MNSESIDFRFFIECDSNPFIIFNSQGKIIYLNNTAEVLLGHVTQYELYEIALGYAPQSFGSKTTLLELQYAVFAFFALSVAYEDEEQIGLRLYQKPRNESRRVLEMDQYTPADINALLEANITFFKLQNDNKLSLLVDQDLPLCRIDQNQFSKLIRKTLETFRASDAIEIILKLLIGEYIIIKEKKELVAQLIIKANGRYSANDRDIKEIAQSNLIDCIFKERSIELHIPMIRDKK